MSILFTAEYPAVPKGIFLKYEIPFPSPDDVDAASEEFLSQVRAVNTKHLSFLTRLRNWLFKPIFSVRVTITKDAS